jgi:hypothetical protein
LQPGQIVVLDNLSVHKSARARTLIEAAGCQLVFLPTYSPDFNPIEHAFATVTGLMRRAEARTRESLIEAMGRALETVSVLDARRFFEHCGYRSVGELLYNCSRRGPSQRLTVPLPGVSRTASERLLG